MVSTEMVGKEDALGPPSAVAFHAGIVINIFLASLSSQLHVNLPLSYSYAECFSPFRVNLRRDVAKCSAGIKMPFCSIYFKSVRDSHWGCWVQRPRELSVLYSLEGGTGQKKG